MKVIGLIGGMSCESTAHYYKHLNDRVRAQLGGLHSAEILMWSIDFAPIARMQDEDRWQDAGAHLAGIGQRLEQAGAEVLVLATNTMHKVADAIEASISIPLIHIANATAQKIRAAGKRKPALLATKFTMEQDFYTGRLREKFGLDVVVPDQADRTLVHQIIYDELCLGRVTDTSRRAFVDVAQQLSSRGGRLPHSWVHRGCHAARREQRATSDLRYRADSCRCRRGLRARSGTNSASSGVGVT